MDINDVRGLATVFILIAFIGICWWAFSPRRKARFDEAANLPFADEAQHEHSNNQQSASSSKTGASSEHDKRDRL